MRKDRPTSHPRSLTCSASSNHPWPQMTLPANFPGPGVQLPQMLAEIVGTMIPPHHLGSLLIELHFETLCLGLLIRG